MDVSLLQLIPPLLILITLSAVVGRLYSALLGRILPKELYNMSRGPIAFAILYVWAIPMEMGYYEFFRAML